MQIGDFCKGWSEHVATPISFHLHSEGTDWGLVGNLGLSPLLSLATTKPVIFCKSRDKVYNFFKIYVFKEIHKYIIHKFILNIFGIIICKNPSL